MKKILSFIPLGIGISAAIIYVFSVIQFRIIGDASTLMQISSRLKVYLYISILGFIFYFFIKILLKIDDNKKIVKVTKSDDENNKDETYEPFDNIKEKNEETYTPNYDYVPVYNKEKDNYVAEFKKEEVKLAINEKEKIEIKDNKYCYNCGGLINNYDKFCSSCGSKLDTKKKEINPILMKIINILEIIIMVLIIVFLLNYLIDNKEKVNPDFKFPLKISVTK